LGEGLVNAGGSARFIVNVVTLELLAVGVAVIVAVGSALAPNRTAAEVLLPFGITKLPTAGAS
jgi:hypothetical protein